ncbi:adherens junction-associated protein 1 [Callorhinus ursinus]|uniref:Adherens junction-associated protein 1 n=2 Tax=Otariidae TaxID=9702 RepID=A0A3Q7MWP0_CALUR|nr:adherens junction-associated protein 1 [Callorhinus ursinus]XP_027435767.1 adherens junction-associated protein 1 [Zalophus californianus]XP_027435778.1 adherens junction-associated protein 1 [Zalophus californianus]XP_027435782.1 adherens junction-associated protein 1 [Zalophus californianus]XP_027435793.1 adherens junction-associated protein 1 [Zalophus californianus]XP_027435803.1 adherens junction-associated protein 1 [Zalophus californianus]XP_027964356.1 adherens junction-associated 
MWIQQLLGLSSMSIHWPGCSLGSHAWILIAMFQLAMDLPSCESLGPGPDFRLLPRPPQRPPRLWSLKSGQAARIPVPVWSPRPARVERSHGQVPSPRAKRAHRPRDQVAALVPRGGLAKPPAAAKSSPSLRSSSTSPSPAVGSGATTDQQALLWREKRHLQGAGFNSFDFRGSRPTTETEFIAWGPTGEEEAPESNTFPGLYGPTTASIPQTRKTTVATTTAPATTATSTTLQTKGVTEPLGPRNRIPVGVSTTEPSTSPSKDDGEDVKPPRILGETSGLAVHQIITITVSLIMVIAALITTLVLKNCCAQSGNTRRKSHQRKINQQEESCQNLTDFTPARVPSSLDIFTAYNETLQCSHECVRASVPVYTDETLHPTAEYKSTFNGNRPSPSDRHLIPVAFVSEKWFEISC